MEPFSSGNRRQILETSLAIFMVGLLLIATFTVLAPFLGVLTYTLILTTATWAAFGRLKKALWGKKYLAAIVYVLIALLIVALPFLYVGSALVEYIQGMGSWWVEIEENGFPPLPEWVASLPIIGDNANSFWEELRIEKSGMITKYAAQLQGLGRWLLSGGLGLIGASLEILLAIVATVVMLVSGGSLVKIIPILMSRIAGAKTGEAMLGAAKRAIQGVAIGVMGSALLEAFVAWLGFYMVSVPHSIGFAALVFFLMVMQLGPAPVWIPITIWLASTGHTGAAIFMGIWGVVVLTGIDSVLKPILIARTGKLPMLILFIGVLGGMAAWGFTGMFIGAVTMAVFWTSIQVWVGEENSPEGSK